MKMCSEHPANDTAANRTTCNQNTEPAGITIPDADPDGIVSMLSSYDRCGEVIHPTDWTEHGWDGKRGGQVNAVTTMNNISRVLRDLHGSLNIIQYGYIVTTVREIKSPFQPDTDYAEKDDVYRIIFEPLGKFLTYAQYGHYSVTTDDLLTGKAPVKP